MKTLALLLTASVLMLGLGACAGTPPAKKECCATGNTGKCPTGDPHCHVKPKKK
jgi:hypothetical protein